MSLPPPVPPQPPRPPPGEILPTEVVADEMHVPLLVVDESTFRWLVVGPRRRRVATMGAIGAAVAGLAASAGLWLTAGGRAPGADGSPPRGPAAAVAGERGSETVLPVPDAADQLAAARALYGPEATIVAQSWPVDPDAPVVVEEPVRVVLGADREWVLVNEVYVGTPLRFEGRGPAKVRVGWWATDIDGPVEWRSQHSGALWLRAESPEGAEYTVHVMQPKR